MKPPIRTVSFLGRAAESGVACVSYPIVADTHPTLLRMADTAALFFSLSQMDQTKVADVEKVASLHQSAKTQKRSATDVLTRTVLLPGMFHW